MGKTGRIPGNQYTQTARGRKPGAGCAIAVFAVLALFGILFLSFTFIPAYLKIHEARSWTETPCVILESKVASKPDSDGTTYQVQVRYQYEVDGTAYTSNNYQFVSVWTSGLSAKQEVVHSLKPGTPATCYVNPANPAEAVIERGFTSSMYLGLLPLAFVVIGVAGILWMLISGRRRDPLETVERSPSASMTTPRVTLFNRPGEGPLVTLSSDSSPSGKFIFILIFGAVWNGIIAVMAWKVILESGGGWSGDICFTLFLIPFALIGLLLIVLTIHTFLAMFNPRPVVRVRSRELKLGETSPLEWEFHGRWDRISRLRIYLEGTEEAQYRKGTRNYTDRSTFARIDIVDTDRDYEIREGKSTFTVPADTMHTFEGRSNKILWKLHIRGEIRRWPDVREEIPLTLLPMDLAPEVQA